jgi:site-specific recombinase XerD
MILLAYRHGLRASELVNLPVSDLDLATGAGSVNLLRNLLKEGTSKLQKVVFSITTATSGGL